ncbi:hypothetical protein GLOIN_2v1761434 [Rhizophagus irregularis DAOM 181602=DAOM 197198]|nr:hypothetical protein GLOIN_2v1761434 [Rhizophagus irregularis DAOM 181602=DAOM 197198]
MSLDTLRNEILSNSDEDRVQVNQRDLIDKILARYSCKFVIFRELMQNSDDAESSSAKIMFKTNGNKITRIIFKNNGFAFRPEDWERLVRIAEGNPDEQKIGAFGVGFYSLFAVTENPFVTSGGQGMAFYWRGKQIYTKRGPRNDDDDKGWTTFLMDTREPLMIPNIEELSKFLVNSLGFTDNLKEISMYIDDKLVTKVSKKMQDPESIDITSRFNTFSSKNMFNLTSVELRCVQLDVERLLLPKKINIKHLRSDEYNMEEASAIFRIAKGSLNVKISKEFSAKMGRITKKSPPNNTSIQMIFTEFDERNTSKDYYNNLSPIFEDLISYPEQGKIYIGFPTNQTTGSSSHLAARVIPTMERELIDFAEQTLAEYNIEMLCLGGTLSRILYEYEMAQMSIFCNETISSDIEKYEEYEETKQPKKRAPEPKTKRSLYKWLTKRFKFSNHANYTSTVQLTSPHRQLLEKWAAHAIAHFTYNASTPNVRVSEIAEKQFFNCLEQNLLILSTNGVHPITDVRLPNPEMAGFIKTVPLVPKKLLEQCESFFNKAKGANLITELSFEDVLVELKSRALSEEEIIKLLKWWISYLSNGNPYDTRLLKFTQIGDSSQTLNTIKFYLNPHKISSDFDIPFEVIPYNISKNFTQQELTNSLKWKELPLVNWANFIVNDPGLETEPKFAEKIHHVLAKNLESIPQQDKETIRLSFIAKRCIPTKFGMKFPNKSYFEDVNLFPNLPTIKFQNSTSGIKYLMEHFGVRKVVELKLILERLVNQEDCNFVGVVKYLASIYDELNDNEKNILKNESIWPKEDLLGLPTTKKIQRFIARDLYVPIRSLRELGLSIIDWNAEWSNSSKGGKFLIELGLQEYPKLETILNLAVPSNDPKIRELALKYFIDNYDKYSVHYKPDEINIAFLPCSKSNTYAKPSECFTNDRCMIMNFKVVREDLRSKAEKFGIQQHPNHDKLVKRLTENPPQGENNAMKVFEYLYSRQHDFTNADWNILNNSEFIPIKNENIHIKPRDCFFKLKDEKLNDFFLCVDFGTKANEFLSKCGVKKQTSNDFAEIKVDPSHKLWKLYVEKYPVILENINPNLEKILNLAAPPTDLKLRTMALKYFIDNFDRKYVGVYNPGMVNIAFLPCSNSNAYARPLDCFINDECMIMNFQIIRKDLRSKAEKFGIQQNPDYTKLTEKLIKNPPQNKNEAKKVFEYLNKFNHNWNTLINSQFIPIQDENSPNNKYIKPNDCFFKLKDDSLNEFFLCVDFGTKANRFLAKCGVREPSSYDFAELSVDPSHKLWNLYVEKYQVILEKINPNLENILELAAPPINPKLRAMALKYFIDNFKKKYARYYKPEVINITFLPCSNSDTCAKPSDCFINDECKIMGFKIIREDLRSKAVDFGIHQNPNSAKLIARLTENPPKSDDVAKKVFEYLNTQQKDFVNSDWKKLENFKFIPIQYESQPNKLFNPRECFFKLKEESLNNFFPCVDLGTKANEFLAKCGVGEPSSYDFAEISVDPSHELWKLYVENYPVILEKINPNLEKILKLATPPTNPKLHAMALKYFVDNFDKKYVKDYKPENIDIAFLPCSNSNSYAKHSECFINDECKIMGFNIIRQDLRSKAGDFSVCQNPNRGFIDSDWKMLKDLEFIPIQQHKFIPIQQYKLIKPRDCFLKLKEESLNSFFTCVDFGIKANEFLAKCGVREPSSYDFDKISVGPTHKLWNLYVEKYPIILEKINPNLEKILNLASPPTNSKFRVTAIKYFIDNFDKKYAKVYKPEQINIAFIPCSNFDACTKPSDCFTNYRCMIMNFKIIHEDLRSKAGKLGVRQNPNRVKLINRLVESPPSNANVAKEVFDYLNTQQESFTDSDWKKLENVKFIPIQSANKLVRPRDCFLKLKEGSLDNFFLWVDFGTKANEFLAKCGVRKPSPYDFSKITVDPSHKLWNLYLENYLKILTKINPNLETILNLAANPIYPKIRELSFKYFVDNFYKESLNNFFPCVDFGTKANEFLAKCGVKKPSSYDFSKISIDSSHKLWSLYLENYLKILTKINPNLKTILNLAAKSNYPKIRELAFKYFVDNFYSKYSKFYKPEEIDVAFLPCSNSISYAKHSECFINDKCKSIGFKIIREDLRSKAGDFGVRQNPNREELINGLTENPPKNKNKAKEVFEYLNTQQEGFTDSDWKKLKDFEFIPIHKKNIDVDLIKPRDCYLKFKDKRLNDFLPCIDFGTNANKFLTKCGVNSDLLFEDAHRLLFKSSRELWDMCKKNTKKYLHVLEKIKEVDNKFPEKNLNKDDVLIAIKTDSEGNNSYCLATVKEIYINDDKVYHKNLNPFTPPDNLRDFYKKLGCSSLHESVTKSVVPYGPIQKTKYSRQLQRIIRERASLFYLNHSEEHIRKDEKWLQKLKVREIEYMETSYKLGSITKNERNDITTNISQKSTISWILYVTPNSNLIDISQQLVNHIFTSHYQNIPYFNAILTAPLSNLINMGIIHPKLQNDQPPQSTSNTFSSKRNENISSENTRDLRNFLQVTIKSRYSNSESNINSIKTCIDENKINYCETMPGYSMHCVGNLQKIELYVSTDVDQSEILSQSRIAPLSQFIYMLKDIADVFKVTPKAIHIFYDNSVNSIAFNRDGALFFNLKFYLELHEQKCKTKPTIDAMTYWFTIYCHVLAHNFIQLHNSEFEFYYSSFAQTYMPDFIELTKKLGDVARKTVITIKNHSKQIHDKHSVYFYSGTSDWGIPGPVSNCEGLVWGTRKTAGPVSTGTVGVFVYHIKDQNQSLAFMWSIPFDYNIYSNWWSIIVYDGFIEANDDLYRGMYYCSPNKGDSSGDSQTYQGNLNFGWRYEGSMGHSGTPIIVVDIYKD